MREEIRQLYELVRELRRYDRDRLGYIERRRAADGKNFFVGEDELVVTDGATAKKLLSGTNRDNYVSLGQFRSPDPLADARANTADWMPARHAAYQSMLRKHALGHALKVQQTFEPYLRSIEGQRIDVVDALQLASGCIVGGLTLGDDAVGIPEIVQSSVRANLPLMNSSWVWSRKAWLPHVRRQRRRVRHMRDTLGRIVRTRYQQRSLASTDLLQSLVDNDGLTREQVAEAANVLLLASFGVPGTAAAWSILALKRRPELEAAARESARSVRDLSNILDDAPLLVAIVNEALRLYPPAWLIGRLNAEPLEIHGLRIPAGCTANIILYSIHRDADEWDRADEFEPERWLDPGAHRKGTFIPFGGGPRVCVGSHLGMVEIVTMLHTFLTTYDLVDAELDERPVVRALLTPKRMLGRIQRIPSVRPAPCAHRHHRETP